MGKKYRCSMTPLIYSIVPIGAAGLVALFFIAFPENESDFPGSLMDVLRPLILCCTAPLIALAMLSMGIYSVILGMAEIRIPQARGKTLVVLAIVLGTLDIAAVAGFLLYLFSLFS